ncbi:hypothetical protein BRARA_H00976 [Brassica rapa]|uniref:Uncharacterized protein n=1 Tax=Brassica campestris TaxID=3711 RepID=A0A397YJW6_BRACM|nr:hypothetical protein BRARA_H00976 [Brassica rapa]
MQTYNKVILMLTYNIMDGTIYQAPQRCSAFAARVVCFFILSIYVHVLLGGHRLSKGFFLVAAKVFFVFFSFSFKVWLFRRFLCSCIKVGDN